MSSPNANISSSKSDLLLNATKSDSAVSVSNNSNNMTQISDTNSATNAYMQARNYRRANHLMVIVGRLPKNKGVRGSRGRVKEKKSGLID